MKSLYRRYRPLKLEDVVGQPQVTEPLIKSLKQGKISHAYLFIGPRGCGKTSVARILAHEVNDFDYKAEDDYVDIIEIDGASNRGIDNIRELREKVAIAPTVGKYKVYIIDEVHMLTKEAFNALLKTLEEPPSHAIFIMATTDAYKVPITISSRSQTFSFKLADGKLMHDFLAGVAKKEGIQIEDDALWVIVKRGGGSYRDSLSLLDQISSLSSAKITKEMIIKTMGLPEDELVEELLNAYTAHDVVKITTLIKELLSSGVKPETLTEVIIGTIINEPKPELISLLSELPEVKAPFAEAKILVAFLKNYMNAPIVATTIPTTPPKLKISKPNVSEAKSTAKLKIDTNTTENTAFDWGDFLDKVKSMSVMVYSQLINTKHSFDNNTLHIYPVTNTTKRILSSINNKKLLNDAISGDVKITIHDITDTPKTEQKDEMLKKISDIMGGEVINDGGENPFTK